MVSGVGMNEPTWPASLAPVFRRFLNSNLPRSTILLMNDLSLCASLFSSDMNLSVSNGRASSSNARTIVIQEMARSTIQRMIWLLWNLMILLSLDYLMILHVFPLLFHWSRRLLKRFLIDSLDKDSKTHAEFSPESARYLLRIMIDLTTPFIW